MGRRALVIGSQCAALPFLPFLPQVAEDLARVLTDPDLGSCAPALSDGKVLLVDPTVQEADQAIEEAVAHASAGEDMLLLAFVGHGEHVGENFFLLPRDAAWPPDSRRALLLATRLKELLHRHSGLDGLVLLVDAAHSGLGALQAAQDWPSTIAQAGGRFEVLTSSDEREAANGCFTATLVEVLRSGAPGLGVTIGCADAKVRIQQECDKQVATYLAFDGRRFTGPRESRVWLGRNPAYGREPARLSRSARQAVARGLAVAGRRSEGPGNVDATTLFLGALLQATSTSVPGVTSEFVAFLVASHPDHPDKNTLLERLAAAVGVHSIEADGSDLIDYDVLTRPPLLWLLGRSMELARGATGSSEAHLRHVLAAAVASDDPPLSSGILDELGLSMAELRSGLREAVRRGAPSEPPEVWDDLLTTSDQADDELAGGISADHVDPTKGIPIDATTLV